MESVFQKMLVYKPMLNKLHPNNLGNFTKPSPISMGSNNLMLHREPSICSWLLGANIQALECHTMLVCSIVSNSLTLSTIARQCLRSIVFSRQEYWRVAFSYSRRSS